MKPISVFIAENVLDDREILKRSLIDFGNQEKLEFRITEADTYSLAIQILEENARRNEFFEIQFIDINFEGDDRGGYADSGFSIIEKAYQICPISIILTFSAKFKSDKLHPVFIDQVKRGLVTNGLGKNASINNLLHSSEIDFRQVIIDFKENLFLWDVWENNNTIITHLNSKPVVKDQQVNLQILFEIKDYLKTTLILLMKRGKIGAEDILNRSLLQMYHRALELYCESDKTEKAILNLANNTLESIRRRKQNTDLKPLSFDKPTALHKIVAKVPLPIAEYGYNVNRYRNKAVHYSPIIKNESKSKHKESGFKITLANIIYAALTIHLYVVGNKKPKITKIIDFISSNKKMKGEPELHELLNHIEYKMK